MDEENISAIDQWFHSTSIVLNESYQLDLRRILSPDLCELIYTLSDYYMYDSMGLFLHLLGLVSHYLTPTSFIYADNQLKHKLNLHLLLIVRAGYERSAIVDHIKQAMNNIQCIRQTGQPSDIQHPFHLNLFCRTDETTIPSGLCLSDKFDEHNTTTHIQRQKAFTIIGTSTGEYVRNSLEIKFQNKHFPQHTTTTNWLMIFLASKARLFCRRSKIFDLTRYPSFEQLIIILNCHCSNLIDFHCDEPQTNQFLCDYLDALSLKATSLEDTHPWMSARYLSAREHVLRISACLRILELTVETLFVYHRAFHSFSQPDNVFFDNCLHIIEQTRPTSGPIRLNINIANVQSAIYLTNSSIKQFEIMFEPTLNSVTTNSEFSPVINQSSSSSSSTSSYPPVPTSPTSKRMKPFIDPTYVKSLELAHEVLLLPFVAFTRTSVYANSKLKRNAAYLDCVIDELKKNRLLIMVRQGVQMVDGTRRRVDLLVKCPPILNNNENINNNSKEDQNDQELVKRLERFGVDYDRYIETLRTLDIGEKYRLSEQCFELLNSPNYKRYLITDLQKIAPLHRVQQQQQQQQQMHRHSVQHDDSRNMWTLSPASSNIKLEPEDFYT